MSTDVLYSFCLPQAKLQEYSCTIKWSISNDHTDKTGWKQHNKKNIKDKTQKILKFLLFLMSMLSGCWTIGPDYTKSAGWIHSARAGPVYLPDPGGWQYYDVDIRKWTDDTTIVIV